MRGRPDDLTAGHSDLVAEHEDFDREITLLAPAETYQLENPGEGEIEKREGHGPVSCVPLEFAKVLFVAPG